MARFEQAVNLTELEAIFSDKVATADEMLEKMVDAGCNVVLKNVKQNMKSSFGHTDNLEKHLKKTVVYHAKRDMSVNCKVGFYGFTDKKTKKYPDGVPAPLIASAREYGTKSGEKKKPFFRKSFNKSEIDSAMKAIESQYIKEQ